MNKTNFSSFKTLSNSTLIKQVKKTDENDLTSSDDYRCEHLLDMLVHNSLIPQFIIKQDGTFILLNQAGRHFLRKITKQKIYNSFNIFSIQYDTLYMKNFIAEIKKSFNGEIIIKQHELLFEDNPENSSWFEFQYFPIFKKNKDIDSVCISVLDITNLKNQQSLLLDSININQALFNAIDEPFLIIDSDLNYVNANEIFFNTFNTDRLHIIETLNCLIWGNNSITQDFLKNFSLSNEDSFFPEKRLWFKVSSKIISLEKQKLIIVIFKNITGLKTELDNVMFIEQSIESSSLGMMIFDKNLKLIYTNSICKKYFDFYNELNISIEALSEKYPNNSFLEIVKNTLISKNIWKGKISCISNKNIEEIFDVNISCLKADGNSIDKFMVIYKSATHETQLEQHLQQSQKLEALGTLAGGIAHDFNNILTAMLGFTELCLMDVEPDDSQFNNLKQIQVAANRAKDMITQILTFSRKTEVELKPLFISSIVKEATKLLRASLPANIKIETNIKNTDCLILGDPTQINQIVMNLCTNAYHAMKLTGGVLSISSKIEMITHDNKPKKMFVNTGEYIVLKVSDTGCGIPDNIKTKIFDPYFTTKSNEEGTGLGLAMVHGIVNSLNGFIELESEVGVGTVFKLYLPVFKESCDKGSSTDNSICNELGNKENILFLDDEFPIVDVSCQLLRKLNYHSYGFTDAFQALDFYIEKYFEIDIIITDMTMPLMSGLEFIERIRELNPVIPIIICSGYSDLLENIDKSNLYNIEIMIKPISVTELSKVLKKMLENISNN